MQNKFYKGRFVLGIMAFELPELGYSYDALEPHFDKETMEIHHSKHHQAYIDKLNGIVEGHPELQGKSAEELVKNLESVSEEVRNGVQNHGGGFLNHSFFWQILKKDVEVSGEVVNAINQEFGNMEDFKGQFKDACTTVFGSGWGWLVVDPTSKKLEIIQTKNQDSPLTLGKIPVIGLDVWEHGYYLKYQNKRPAYVDAFFNLINWGKVNEHYLKAISP